MLESQASNLQPENLTKKTSPQIFSFEFCEICNNIYFVKPLRAAASVMCHLIKDLTTATATDTTNATTTVPLWEIT